MTARESEPSGKGARWFLALVSIIVAIVTFDPHFENIKLLYYAWDTFLPELTIASLVIAGFVAARTGVLHLVARHRLIFACLFILLAWSSWGLIKRSATKADGPGAAEISTFMERPMTSLLEWLGTRHEAYSLRQAKYFHKEMRLRAVDAFYAQDIQRTAAYLRASKSIFEPDDQEGKNVDDALSFLVSRERYIANHKERIAKFEPLFPLAPARLYMMRAVSQLERDDQQAPELTAVRARIYRGGNEAKAAVSDCLMTQNKPSAGDDGRMMINLMLDAMGQYTVWRSGIAGEQWCKSLQYQLPNHATRNSFLDQFDTLMRNLWGSALDDPSKEIEPGGPIRSRSNERDENAIDRKR
ncbi:hypothetical protein U5A82_02980 [Sphingobium sp. CR2-8]|uniref:hypothetical protein n=1 Tax=Sphingobium sp. CR2-8 TaxID=1306534 RepID=UPI002DB7AABB|nr:hypothetical protein [Sphingobium sp. CR2-8]MEC3909472.1 hypothetical protein [Sphingobium sp. CR2-8]